MNEFVTVIHPWLIKSLEIHQCQFYYQKWWNGLITHWGELVTGNSPMSGEATNGWIKIPNESRVAYSQGKIIPHEWLSRSGEKKFPHEWRSHEWGNFFLTTPAKPWVGDNFALGICHEWRVGNFSRYQFFSVCDLHFTIVTSKINKINTKKHEIPKYP